MLCWLLEANGLPNADAEDSDGDWKSENEASCGKFGCAEAAG